MQLPRNYMLTRKRWEKHVNHIIVLFITAAVARDVKKNLLFLLSFYKGNISQGAWKTKYDSTSTNKVK